MNKFQRMSGAGGEPRRHGPSGGGGPLTIYHRILSPPRHPVGDPVSVTLMTTQATIHICMMSQLVY
jgi:hypothetical protein